MALYGTVPPFWDPEILIEMIEDEKISKEINSIMKMNTICLSSGIMNNDPAMAIHLKKWKCNASS